MKKTICVIANGYAEEMMAANLMNKLRQELQHKKLDDYQLLGGSLVSSGRWFQEERFPTFFSGGMSPSGGFPTQSVQGFVEDLMAGSFWNLFKLRSMINKWSRYNLEAVIVVGDFLLMMLAVSAIKKHCIPLLFIPTAKSDYIQEHFSIEKRYIKKYASIAFPRDQITSDNFRESGINALYYGNLMQDLLEEYITPLSLKEPVVALLPGSRKESYNNLGLILDLLPEINTNIHWALVQAASLNSEKIGEIFHQYGWTLRDQSNHIGVWFKGTQTIHCYPSTYFDQIASSCIFGISLAGTAGEQITGLGKPVIGFKGTGSQSTNIRMENNEKLLGEAFIYPRDYPQGVVQAINRLIDNPSERTRRGNTGLIRMGQRGASQKIASYIVEHILKKMETK
ncbi:MAG: lipid-A-disaccharide synthase-related protein [Brevinema sp.]